MEKNGKTGFWQALSLAWEFGYVIAIPIVIFALLGRILDKKFGTSPWLLLAGILISILISSFGLIAKFKKMLKKLESDNRKESK
ncbi:AtpZ/AtpI family protein [Candidatus Parcubacteria bacterium]|jgi:F0F1-type ATP synthase assembly protein I|nr:MAG: AtpZ/AtpI family protein [Candidatus Parcubacteria bacterium]